MVELAWGGFITTRVLQHKLDGVGPVDNRPSTDKLNHFVQKKSKEGEQTFSAP